MAIHFTRDKCTELSLGPIHKLHAFIQVNVRFSQSNTCHESQKKQVVRVSGSKRPGSLQGLLIEARGML